MAETAPELCAVLCAMAKQKKEKKKAGANDVLICFVSSVVEEAAFFLAVSRVATG